MQTITLTGKKELDIYINPQRQRLLRALTLANEPVTPKQLSTTLGISPSSVQHHIAKLVELGVVGLSHTQRIHGITAHFYQALPVTVRIGYVPDAGDAAQRLALIQNGVNAVLTGFSHYVAQGERRTAEGMPVGDVLWGISRLQPKEAQELFAQIRQYIAAHEAPVSAGEPWEYALIAYPAKEDAHA